MLIDEKGIILRFGFEIHIIMCYWMLDRNCINQMVLKDNFQLEATVFQKPGEAMQKHVFKKWLK